MPVVLTYVAGRILDVQGEPRSHTGVIFLPAPGDSPDVYYQSRKVVDIVTTSLGKLPDSDAVGHLNQGLGLVGGVYKIRIDKNDVYKIRVPTDGGAYQLTSLIIT